MTQFARTTNPIGWGVALTGLRHFWEKTPADTYISLCGTHYSWHLPSSLPTADNCKLCAKSPARYHAEKLLAEIRRAPAQSEQGEGDG